MCFLSDRCFMYYLFYFSVQLKKVSIIFQIRKQSLRNQIICHTHIDSEIHAFALTTCYLSKLYFPHTNGSVKHVDKAPISSLLSLSTLSS